MGMSLSVAMNNARKKKALSMYQKGISNKYTQIKLVLVSLKDMIVSSKNIDKCEHKCIYSNRVSFFRFSFSYFPWVDPLFFLFLVPASKCLFSTSLFVNILPVQDIT